MAAALKLRIRLKGLRNHQRGGIFMFRSWGQSLCDTIESRALQFGAYGPRLLSPKFVENLDKRRETWKSGLAKEKSRAKAFNRLGFSKLFQLKSR